MKEPSKEEQKTINTGLIILQWLTYAFWGWTVFFTSILANNIFSHFLTQNNDDVSSLYAVGAVVLLLPISIVCNWLYSKHEPTKKSGASSIILVIHAVLFAIFSIGALTSVVFSLLQLLINSGDTSSIQIALYSGLIVAILYCILFLRTIGPEKPMMIRKYFLTIMTAIIGTFLIFGFIGPVSGALNTRDDRLIDNNLYLLQSGIDSYLIKNSKLPDNLNQLSLTGDAKILISKNLLEYTPDSKPPRISENTKLYYYQICANYKKANVPSDIYGTPAIYRDSSSQDEEGYSAYIDVSHAEGKHCYKVISSVDKSSPLKEN